MNRLLGGRYEILEKIGEGGMAVVYKARCTLLNRFVAIKILKPEFLSDKKFIENFRHESQAAASINHPNIVNIYDVGLEGKNIHYIVMEYVEGETLSSIIERVGQLSDSDTVYIARQVASALACAHRNNIIHRDVKPHNILVNEDGTAKITDFGIARAVTNSTLVAGDSIMGSVHYFSPEQARGGYVDGKSDLYSLGIVMYEMSTGRVPFEGENPVSVAMMHIHDEMNPPSYYNPEISPALEAIIIKATQKYQVNRFADAEEMLAALNAISYSDLDNYESGAVPYAAPVLEQDDTEQDYQESGYNDGTDASGELQDDYYEDVKRLSADDPGQMGYDEADDAYQNMPAQSEAEVAEEKPYMEEYTNPKKKKKGKKKKKRFFTAARVFGIILGIAAAVFASMGVLWGIDYFKTPEVEVPPVLGMEYEVAQSTLQAAGLEIEKGDSVYSNQYPANQICAQTPAEGEKVKKGYAVKVSISKGPSNTGVPSVVGKTYDEAVKLLADAGYEVGKVEERDDEEAEERVVLSQSPDAGSQPAAGTLIDLVISAGKAGDITMINLLGYSVDSATSMLQTAGLTLAGVEYDYSSTYGEGKIMGQSVSSGSAVTKGTGITVTVSKGSKPFGTSGGTSSTVPLTLDYTMSNNDVFEIRINLVQDGTVTLVHDKVHYKSNNGEEISITGSGTATVLIYYDETLVNEGTIDFGTGEFSF